MTRLWHLLLSALSLEWFPSYDSGLEHDIVSLEGVKKSIAIVGGGSGGLGALQVLLDVARQQNLDWEIVLYEQRKDVGGVWLQDPNTPSPPELPESPVYPLLRTNTPHPTMTYLDFPFPPLTNLFPSHDYLQRYHASFASHNGLYQYIQLNHTVEETTWVGNSTHGAWNVRVKRSPPHRASRVIPTEDHYFSRTFDHLVVASGHNHYPHIPTWEGQDEWLASTPPGTPKREIIHSIFWRDPERYAGRTAVVLGSGASGNDVVTHIGHYAKKIYHSVTRNKTSIVQAPAIPKPRITHFTKDEIHFEDGTSVSGVDSLVLGTGYELRIPFLTAGNALRVDPAAKSINTSSIHPPPPLPLTTNLRYIRPLYRQILSLSTSFPPNALYFIGLPINISNAPSDQAQALFVAHTIANSSVLPPRLSLLRELEESEEELRQKGYDPDHIGHVLVDLKGNGESRSTYQDEVIDFLKGRNVTGLPLRGSGDRFVDDWRRDIGKLPKMTNVRKAWAIIESKGKEEETRWLKGVHTEVEWADLLERLAKWGAEQELEDLLLLDHDLIRQKVHGL